MMEIDKNRIYTGNKVTGELVNGVKQVLNKFDSVFVCFDVIGRTKHMQLSQELYAKLDRHKYDAVITSNYGCKISKKKEDI